MSTRTVYKYPVPIQDAFDLYMPADAQILYVAIQHEYDTPKMWALVSPDAPMVKRYFRLAGTGHPIDENIKAHVGSFLMNGGDLVFHVFEVFRGESGEA
jgi:hypothetical protein